MKVGVGKGVSVGGSGVAVASSIDGSSLGRGVSSGISG
jgi:hypothetical protein